MTTMGHSCDWTLERTELVQWRDNSAGGQRDTKWAYWGLLSRETVNEKVHGVAIMMSKRAERALM